MLVTSLTFAMNKINQHVLFCCGTDIVDQKSSPPQIMDREVARVTS